eukprot:768392-Hanusia_phi.AAC.16
MYRFLQLKANMIYIMRVNHGPWPVKGLMRRYGTDFILYIPDLAIDLSTIQICSGEEPNARYGGNNFSKLVHCEFDSNFKSPIEVNVDFYQYEYLQQLFKRYKVRNDTRLLFIGHVTCSCKNSRREDFSSDLESSAPLNDIFSPLSESQSRSSLQRDKNSTQGLKLDYRCLKFKLEPPIAAISEVPIDIITILSWLGIRKRETIVGMVSQSQLPFAPDHVHQLHEGIIQNFEKALYGVNSRLKSKK